MHRIWLPAGRPGIAINGTAYQWDSEKQRILLAGTLAVEFEGTGIPLRLRHTDGFRVDDEARKAGL